MHWFGMSMPKVEELLYWRNSKIQKNEWNSSPFQGLSINLNRMIDLRFGYGEFSRLLCMIRPMLFQYFASQVINNNLSLSHLLCFQDFLLQQKLLNRSFTIWMFHQNYLYQTTLKLNSKNCWSFSSIVFVHWEQFKKNTRCDKSSIRTPSVGQFTADKCVLINVIE